MARVAVATAASLVYAMTNDAISAVRMKCTMAVAFLRTYYSLRSSFRVEPFPVQT